MRVAILAMGVLLALTGCAGSGGSSASSPATAGDDPLKHEGAVVVSAPMVRPGHPPTRAEVIGTWTPITLLGDHVDRIRRINGNRPTISFGDYTAGLGWTAYDGCNWTSGRARLRQSGGLSTSQQVTTTRGCIRPGGRAIANVEVVTRTARLDLRGDRLHCYDAAGKLLGTYVRTRPGL